MRWLNALLFFLCLTFLNKVSKGNSLDSLKKLLNTRKYSSVSSFLVAEDSINGFRFSYNQLLNREIVSGFDEIKIETEELIPTDKENVSTVKTYIIELIVKNDTIIYCRLINHEIESLPIRVLKFKDSKPIKHLKKAFKQNFGGRLKIKNLFKGERELYVYGEHCGYFRVNPSYREKLNTVLKNNDTLTLRKWMSSTITELQVMVWRVYIS